MYEINFLNKLKVRNSYIFVFNGFLPADLVVYFIHNLVT